MLSVVRICPEAHGGLSVRECAAMVGRSCSWVRDHIQSGALKAARHEGRYTVSAESLTELMRHLCRPQDVARNAPKTALHLIIDNTKTTK